MLTFNKKHKGYMQKESFHQEQGCLGKLGSQHGERRANSQSVKVLAALSPWRRWPFLFTYLFFPVKVSQWCLVQLQDRQKKWLQTRSDVCQW